MASIHAPPQLSIVTRHFNEPGNQVPGCRRRAARAEGIQFEFIVVDNGSVEDPEAVCSQVEGVRLERAQSRGQARHETAARW